MEILPEFHPLNGALLEQGRVALAPLPEGGAGAVHNDNDMQVFANALSEKGDQVAAVALVRSLLS